MSDYIEQELTWNDEVDEVVESTPTSFPDFGTMKLVGVRKVQLFASGGEITLPNVVINGQAWSRKGIKFGWTQGNRNNCMAYFILRESVNMKTLEPFQAVDYFTNATSIPVNNKDGVMVISVGGREDTPPVLKLNEKQQKAFEEKGTAWVSEWSNLQYVALHQSLTKEQLDKFGKGEPIHYRADTWTYQVKESNQLDENGNPRKFYSRYRYNFTIFASKAEMEVARNKYRESEGVEDAGDSGMMVKPYWPKTWESETVVTWAWNLAKTVTNPQALAIQTMMVTGPNGGAATDFATAQPAPSIGGGIVDVKQSLADLLDVPVDTIEI